MQSSDNGRVVGWSFRDANGNSGQEVARKLVVHALASKEDAGKGSFHAVREEGQPWPVASESVIADGVLVRPDGQSEAVDCIADLRGQHGEEETGGLGEHGGGLVRFVLGRHCESEVGKGRPAERPTSSFCGLC